jgi:NlpC/P60 family/Bacterial dipeptidyl-peptidase Sh3 domain
MNEERQYFGLSGPSRMFDRRINAIRGDLADIALAGKMFAPHYAVPVMRMCLSSHALLYQKPGGEAASEVLHSERFWVLDVSGGMAWGYCDHDHYVGYIAADALGDASLPVPLVEPQDPLAIAETFIDLPYVWGGRGGAGIDCSGLVQRALAGRSIAAPRDSDMQGKTLGTSLAKGDPLIRGDIIFFPGHVGMMIDGDHLIHANSFHGKTVIEPLDMVAARYAKAHDGVGITAKRRIAA